jgi:hypothetical protein
LIAGARQDYTFVGRARLLREVPKMTKRRLASTRAASISSLHFTQKTFPPRACRPQLMVRQTRTSICW